MTDAAQSDVAGWRIVDWDKHYEIPGREKGKRAKERGDPLRYVRWWAHGSDLTQSYRLMLHQARNQAGEQGDMLGLATFGLFAKLVELAAKQPRARRDGTIRNRAHQPASLEEITFMAGYLPTSATLVATLLKLMCRPEIGWVEQVGDHSTDGQRSPPTDTRRGDDDDASGERRPANVAATSGQSACECDQKHAPGDQKATSPDRRGSVVDATTDRRADDGTASPRTVPKPNTLQETLTGTERAHPVPAGPPPLRIAPGGGSASASERDRGQGYSASAQTDGGPGAVTPDDRPPPPRRIGRTPVAV